MMDTGTETERPDPMDRAIDAVLHLQPIMHRKMQREVFFTGLRQLGLDIAAHHVIIMGTLQNLGRASSSEVGEVTYISKAQMTHSTNKLIRMGLLESHPDTRDKRKSNLQLTAKGRYTIDRMHHIVVGLLKERLSSLPPDEVEKLGRSLEEAAGVFMKLK
jgi:DNA-binding MarR family transcriptional regulator